MFIIFHHCSVQMMFIITPPIVHPPFHVKNHHFCCKTRWMLVAEVGEVESCAHGSWGPKKTQPLPKSSRLELFFYVCVKMVNRQNPQFDGIFVHFSFFETDGTMEFWWILGTLLSDQHIFSHRLFKQCWSAAEKSLWTSCDPVWQRRHLSSIRTHIVKRNRFGKKKSFHIPIAQKITHKQHQTTSQALNGCHTILVQSH